MEETSVTTSETGGKRLVNVFLTDVITIVKQEFRELFGPDFTERCGHFVGSNMSQIIDDFMDWIDYPKGDFVLKGHTNMVGCAVISDDGLILFTGSVDRTIIARDMMNHKVIRQWEAHSKSVQCLSYGKGMLISGSMDSTIKMWDNNSDEDDEYHLIRILKGHSDTVTSVELNESCDIIASCSNDYTIRIWLSKSGQCLRMLKGHEDRPRSVRFINSSTLLSVAFDGSLRVWDLNQDLNVEDGSVHSQTAIKYVPLMVDSSSMDVRIFNMNVNCDHSRLFCTTKTECNIYEWPGLELINTIAIKYAFNGEFHPLNPHLLALANRSEFHGIVIFDIRDGRVIHSFRGHLNTVRQICFTQDGQRMISVSNDDTSRIWDASVLLH